MELCLIWAQDRHRAMGLDDGLPWRLPEHLQHLAETTAAAPLIMGRHTWESALPALLGDAGQKIVLSHLDGTALAGAIRANTLADALLMAGGSQPAQSFVIGGASLFARMLPVAQRVYVTDVDVEIATAGSFAPELAEGVWLPKRASVMRSASGPQYQFIEYRRRTTAP